MENFNAPFRFDYVGSFLRPAHLKQARADFEAGQITKAELESIENEAITDLIKSRRLPDTLSSQTENSAEATGIWILCGDLRESNTLNWITAISSTGKKPLTALSA